MEKALQTIDYSDKEREYVPWVAAMAELGYLGRCWNVIPYMYLTTVRY